MFVHFVIFISLFVSCCCGPIRLTNDYEYSFKEIINNKNVDIIKNITNTLVSTAINKITETASLIPEKIKNSEPLTSTEIILVSSCAVTVSITILFCGYFAIKRFIYNQKRKKLLNKHRLLEMHYMTEPSAPGQQDLQEQDQHEPQQQQPQQQQPQQQQPQQHPHQQEPYNSEKNYLQGTNASKNRAKRVNSAHSKNLNENALVKNS